MSKFSKNSGLKMQGGMVMLGTNGVMGYTPAIPAAYYPVIGRIIINWSFLEQNIDLCLSLIHI